MKILPIILGTVAGHIAYQYFGGTSDYSVAFERSYFQIMGVISWWLCVKYEDKILKVNKQ
jgi:hypothetical protein